MKINHENAMKLWTERFGKGVEKAEDRRGRPMLKTAFGDEGSQYGWNIHHQSPKRGGGTSAKENLEPVHFLTHQEINGQ
ncbi:MAG: hypothetical protein LBG27_01560 [Spirochaetaceae bacterium]|jgi:hypothetical protein|nr:hypothetical protein [Spirochaetaceae bacterium]